MRKLGMIGVMAAVAMVAMAGSVAWAAGEAGTDGKAQGNTKVFTAGAGAVTITVTTDANAPAVKVDGAKVEVRQAGESPDHHVKTIQARPAVAGGEAKGEGEKGKEGKEGKVIHLRGQLVDGGWAGLHVTPVPAAVAAQLDLKDRGVMVVNIIKGSPAEKAGLQRYDVVVAADKGKDLANVEAFIASVRAHKPGQQVDLTVIRKGVKVPVTLALAAAPAPDAKFDYLYEQDADESWQDQLKLHKGLIRKGPQGWSMELPEGGATWEKPVTIPLPPELLKVLPNQKYGEFRVVLGGPGDTKKSFKVVKRVDGATIEVEGIADGSIVVRRIGPGDKKGEAKFANFDELQKKDPDAFELCKGVTTHMLPGPGGPGDVIYIRSPIVIDGKALSKEAAEKARQVEKELEKWIKEWGEKARKEAGDARQHIARAIEPAGRHYDFQVGADGSIRVEIREGGDTAKLTFKDAKEMAIKAEAAYEAYCKLLKGGK